MQYSTEQPIVYFDTSAWNHLTKSPDKADLVSVIRSRTSVVRASVISAAEILLTPSLETRQQLCKTVIDLHGDWSLLENPFDLPRLAAEAYFAGEADSLTKSTVPGRSLYSQLLNPTKPNRDAIAAWLKNMNQNLETFISQSKPAAPLNVKLCSKEFIGHETLAKMLRHFPASQKLKLSAAQISELCDNCDIWRAVRATMAAILDLSFTHAPLRKKGKRRPGGTDLWQAIYLAVVHVFVVNDIRMRDVVREIASLLPFPRHVLTPVEFYEDHGFAASASRA